MSGEMDPNLFDPVPYPSRLQQLFDDPHFLSEIRSYNTAMPMGSLIQDGTYEHLWASNFQGAGPSVPLCPQHQRRKIELLKQLRNAIPVLDSGPLSLWNKTRTPLVDTTLRVLPARQLPAVFRLQGCGV